MRSGITAVASAFVLLGSGHIEAAPHGGGHRVSTPKPAHFSAPPTPHYSPPAAPRSHATSQGPTSRATGQGMYNPGFTPHTSSQSHASAGVAKSNGKTRLHNLSNQLQEYAHANSAKAMTVGTVANGARSKVSGSSSTPASTSTVSNPSTAAPSHQTAITGELSFPTAPFQLTHAGANRSSSVVSTNTRATLSTANSGGQAAPLSVSALPLTLHPYGTYGYPAIGLSPYNHRYYGAGYGARSSGSRYYGNRNGNSMYFQQMRRLSNLVNALNGLNKGSAVGASHTNRLRGALTGVVFGNGQPPYQTVNQLAMDLATHLPNRTTPMLNTGQLARSLMVAMNGSGGNMADVQQAIGHAHSILSTSGVNQPGVQKIGSDMMMVASWGTMAQPIAQIW